MIKIFISRLKLKHYIICLHREVSYYVLKIRFESRERRKNHFLGIRNLMKTHSFMKKIFTSKLKLIHYIFCLHREVDFYVLKIRFEIKTRRKNHILEILNLMKQTRKMIKMLI
jgi:hypothetical protein